MKVLITGGCGFLGSNIAAAFLERGEDVYVLDAMFRLGAEENLKWLQDKANDGHLFFQQVDVSDEGDLSVFFKKFGPFDYVCHLAGQVAMTTSLSDPKKDFMTNSIGTFNVLEAVRGFSPGAFIAYSSTNKVYGDLGWLELEERTTRFHSPEHFNGLAEDLNLDFASPYGCSKGSADQYVRDWSRNFGIRSVVFRHSSIYGGRQYATYDQGWVGWFCRQALIQQEAAVKGERVMPFSISGTGKQVRDMLHADDLVALYFAAYENREKASGEIFNIGGGIKNSLSLIELFARLEEILGLNNPLIFKHLPRRNSDQDWFVADIRKAIRFMNWRPKVGLEQGLARMLDWQREIIDK